MDKKIAVFFPGIGYTNDKPLLYYSKKLLKTAGYEEIDISYTGFDNNIKGNKAKMLKAFENGYSQALNQINEIDFSQYEDIIFISKSIGTAIAAKLAIDKDIPARNVYLTPLEYTFMSGMRAGIAFTGTSDPWVETEVIKDKCAEYKIPLTIITEGNHSLETEDLYSNIEIVKAVIIKIEDYILGDIL